MTDTLRFGALGAARITPPALIDAARKTEGVVVRAVAARDRARAEEFAAKHAIPVVLGSYEELIASPEIDCIYNALPNSLHAEWTVRALRAGKHVLCEKPLASNAEEAAQMRAVAHETGRRLVEAFHWRHHPLAARIRELLAGGAIGRIQRVDAVFTVRLPPTDIRFDYALAGGALMDLGCYTVHFARFVAGEPEVVSAEIEQGPPNIDVDTRAELRFPGGVTGSVYCSMKADKRFRATVEVRGERGVLHVTNPLAPHFGHELKLTVGGAEQSEKVEGEATYVHQLRAFADHVRKGVPVPTDLDDSVANMRVIDAIYRAAGLPPRGT